MIFAVLVAILVSVGAGVWAERRHGEGAQRAVQRAVKWALWGIIPPIVIVITARLELSSGVGAGIVFGYLVLAAVGLLAWVIGSRVLHLPRSSTGALIVTSILANTGYLGIPLILVLLGGDEVGFAIVWDSIISYPMAFIVAFAIGAAFGDHGASDVRDRILSFFTKNPIPWAFAIGLLLPDAWVSDGLFDAMKILASSLLPLGFFMVGVQLSAEGEHGTFRFPPPLTAPVATVLGLRLLVAPLLLLGIAAATVSIPDAYHLQAAMPCGINALIVAHVYELDLRLTSAAIAWSTAIFAVEVAILAPFL
ncbi:MAG: AEC family transporter [Solirubrobacteraceae bacterium]|nr:AEC family transporter [Solirubrobacteraceae bacterium]